MAKAKSPKTSRTKTQSSQNKKNGATHLNGAAETPVTHAEQAADAVVAQQSVDLSATSLSASKFSAPKEAPEHTDAAPLPSLALDLESAIRQRAYQLYLERDGSPGNPSDDWARAEREVLEAFHRHRKSA